MSLGRSGVRRVEGLVVVAMTSRGSRVSDRTRLSVTVQSVAGRAGEYLASFCSEPLDATFSVYFRDNLSGALALHAFADMIRYQYGVSQVSLEISDKAVLFKSQAVLDVLAPGRRG